MLPKRYPPEFSLPCERGTYGKPEYFYTDDGKDFRSNHLRQIGTQLGFTCELRDAFGGLRLRPSEGGAEIALTINLSRSASTCYSLPNHRLREAVLFGWYYDLVRLAVSGL
ncbi:MAG: hypothetical protein RLO19_12080 [Coleofasciculus sp. G2-EDA-02]